MAARVVLVTGGAAGIGWAAARRFAAQGDRVMIADIDGAAAERRAAELGTGHGALAVDMGEAEGPGRAVRECVARWGRLDVLVNNAGIIDTGGTQVVDQPIEALRRLLAINLLGIERASVAAHAVMRAQETRGVIVNLASGAALRAIPLRNGYSASKAGIVAVTRAHGCAWAGDGIRVNALAPGYTRTDLVDELIRRGRVDPARAASRIPLGRMAEPAEMAACIVHLASPAARGTIGSLLIADGGSTAYGGSENAAMQRGAAPRTPPPGTPVYVIAGASTRLGAACARVLATTGGETIATDAAGLRHAIETAASRFGRLDGLINAAGTDGLIADDATLADQLEAHLEAQFRAAQVAGRVMLAQGFGSIVNLTGTTGQLAGLGAVAGSGAAASVGMLTRTMACEWGGSGIRVNALAAGPLEGDDPAWRRRMPLGRLVDPAAVAETAAFLLSPDAGYVTGTTLTVDGGLTAYAGPDLEPPP